MSLLNQGPRLRFTKELATKLINVHVHHHEISYTCVYVIHKKIGILHVQIATRQGKIL